MLGEESRSADYWKKCGDEALANGVKHVVMMVSETKFSEPHGKRSDGHERAHTGLQLEM